MLNKDTLRVFLEEELLNHNVEDAEEVADAVAERADEEGLLSEELPDWPND